MPTNDIVYDYRAVPTVKRFSESNAFIRGICGPFGSGKSSGCVIELVKLAQQQPIAPDGKRHSRFVVVRNTYPQLIDTTINTFMQWLPPGQFGQYFKSEHRYLISGLDKTILTEVLFRALDRPEHVSNLLSLEVTAAWVNEAREVPYAVIQALQGRVGRYPKVTDGGCVRHCIIMDTNPPDTDSWWYKLFEEQKPANAELFRQPSGMSANAENLPFLPKDYYQNILQSMDEQTAEVYVHGNYGFTRDGKPCYPEYNDNIHCVEVEPVKTTVYRGWDFGITPACVFSQILPDGRWLIFDEITAELAGIDTFSDAILDHTSRKYPWAVDIVDIGDPAGNQRTGMTADKDAKTCFDILHGKNINIVGGEQSIQLRLESVRKPLHTLVSGKPQLIVHPRCKKVRKGFQGRYQFKKVRLTGTEERYHDTPDKNEYSHPHDCVQYTAGKLFGAVVKGNQAHNARHLKVIKYPNSGIV
jgi:hypothetical protein